MILAIVLGAIIFNKFIAITRLPYALAEWVVGLDMPAPGRDVFDHLCLHDRRLLHGRIRAYPAHRADLLPGGHPLGLQSDLVRHHHHAGDRNRCDHATGGV